MSDIIKIEDVKKVIMPLRGHNVIPDLKRKLNWSKILTSSI